MKTTRKQKKARQRAIHRSNLLAGYHRRQEKPPLSLSQFDILAAMPTVFTLVNGATTAKKLFSAYRTQCESIQLPHKRQTRSEVVRARNSDRSREGRQREAMFHKQARRPHMASRLASVSGRAGRTLEILAAIQMAFAAAKESEQADDINYALES